MVLRVRLLLPAKHLPQTTNNCFGYYQKPRLVRGFLLGGKIHKFILYCHSRAPHTSGNLESRNKIRSFSNKQTGSRGHARDDNQKECYPLVFAGTERSGLCCLLGSYLKGHTGRFLSSIRCFPFFYNNRSWTTTFQDDGNDKQRIPDYNFRE